MRTTLRAFRASRAREVRGHEHESGTRPRSRALHRPDPVRTRAGAHLPPHLAVRGARLAAGASRGLLRAGAARAEPVLREGSRGRRPRLLQRLPAPRSPARGGQRPQARAGMSLPRLDLRARRPAPRGSGRRQDAGVRRARDLPHPGAERDRRWVRVRQPRPERRTDGDVVPGHRVRARRVSAGSRAAAGGVHARGDGTLQLEGVGRELQRVLPLPAEPIQPSRTAWSRPTATTSFRTGACCAT